MYFGSRPLPGPCDQTVAVGSRLVPGLKPSPSLPPSSIK